MNLLNRNQLHMNMTLLLSYSSCAGTKRSDSLLTEEERLLLGKVMLTNNFIR